MEPTAAASLTDQFRHLLVAVKGAFGLEGRRGLLAGPLALLVWFRTRRMRREAEAAAKQFVALIEQLVVLLEQFRAGKLPPPPTPEVGEAREAAEAKPGRTKPFPLRFAEREGPAKREGEVYSPRRTLPEAGEPVPNCGLRRRSATSASRRSAPVCAPPRPAPSSRDGVTPRVLAPRARPPPDGLIFVANSLKGLEQRRETCAYFVAIPYRTAKPHCPTPIVGRGSPRFSRNVAPPYSR